MKRISINTEARIQKIFIGASLFNSFLIQALVFFTDVRHQKQSLTLLNMYFENALAGERHKSGNKT